MSAKIFGISWGLIVLVLIVWFIARRWGDSVPFLSKLG